MSDLALAAQAAHCVRWLRAQNLDVLCVRRGTPAPRVIVRACPLCDAFEGAVSHYQRGPCGEQRYKTVMRLGCEVRWAEARDGS